MQTCSNMLNLNYLFFCGSFLIVFHRLHQHFYIFASSLQHNLMHNLFRSDKMVKGSIEIHIKTKKLKLHTHLQIHL